MWLRSRARSHLLVSSWWLLMLVPSLVISPTLAEKNRYVEGGCLKINGWNNTRVCTSLDSADAVIRGDCRRDSFEYMEIRIAGQAWESALFQAWVLQIVLSEILNVPTTVEGGTPDAKLDFYEADENLVLGTSYDWSCIERGWEVGDCQDILATTTAKDYASCCHFIPELWQGQFSTYDKYVKNGHIEPRMSMGTVGMANWYVPKFTAERNPSFLSYAGLAGEKNRHVLANYFHTPTTWLEYCTKVSPTRCEDDIVAQRPPGVEEVDRNRYYVPGVYQGHFRVTEKNDCDRNPTNCTGHIADLPCHWDSFAVSQALNLGIAVEGRGSQWYKGYSYPDLLDIISASNATKSNLLLIWWQPEPFLQQFVGTDMELTPITLPAVSQECSDHRLEQGERCSDDFLTRRGDPRGACGTAPDPVRTAISTKLFSKTHDESIPFAARSPGYEFLSGFKLSNADIGSLFDYHAARTDSNWRESVCDWVVDNLDKIERFIPETYPRVHRDGSAVISDPIHVASTSFASVAIIVVVFSASATYRQSRAWDTLRAELDFLWLLLHGLFLVSLGSLFLALTPSNGLCVSVVWLTNVGYTLEFVPLIATLTALQRFSITASGRNTFHRYSLFRDVSVTICSVVLFLVVWTAKDPPAMGAEVHLENEKSNLGETFVTTTYYCRSESDGWRYASVGIRMAMLLVATLRACQNRGDRDSSAIAIMIYSHFVFACLWLSTLFLESSISLVDMMQVRSIIFSLDTIVTIGIYFVPKLVSGEGAEGEGGDMDSSTLEGSTVRRLQIMASVAGAKHKRMMENMAKNRTTEAGSLSNGSIVETEDSAKTHSNDEGGNGSGAGETSIKLGSIHCTSCGDEKTVCRKCVPARQAPDTQEKESPNG